MKTISTDVLVVGAGPSGLTAATLLAEYGVSALTITRYPSTAHTPRAHITNIRTMEIFRDLGIVPNVERASQKLSFLRHNIMAHSLAGMEISRYRSYGTPADRLSDYAEASPCVPLNCPQHVMEPVAGYLLLAEHLIHDPERFSTAWNFGPPPTDCRPVAELAQLLAAAWGHGATVRAQPEDSIFEETLLSLDSTHAETALGWRPRWTLDTAVLKAAEWYRAHGARRDMWELTQQQIQQFESVVGKTS